MQPTLSPELAALIEQLGSLDPEVRFQALESVKRYAGHRKVTQAVFELRNDGDRRVRALAREFLEESDRRTSGSLAIPGQESAEVLDELLAELAHSSPFERVTALRQLRQMAANPRIDAAILKLRKDPDHSIRMMVEQMLEEKERDRRRLDDPKPKVNDFDNGVLVASPYSRTEKKAWKESTADRLGPEMIPYFGFFYLAFSLPIALLCLWVWAYQLDYLRPEQAPDPSIHNFLSACFGLEFDPVELAIAGMMMALAAAGGLGTMLRQEWGRRCILLFHSIEALLGLFLPNVFRKIIGGTVTTIILFFLTRRDIVKSFKGHDEGKKGPPPADYGQMERKVW